MGRSDAVQPAPERRGRFGSVVPSLLMGTVGGLALLVLMMVPGCGSKPDGSKPPAPATPTAVASSDDPAFPPGATPATADPSPNADIVDGLPLPKRQEIFLALSRVAADANREGLARYPLRTFDGNRLELMKNNFERSRFNEEFIAKGRHQLRERYKVKDATLERINQEGAEKKWPQE